MISILLAISVLQAATPAFEVASIKPSKSAEKGFSTHERGGQVFLESIPLVEAVKMAYDLKDYAVSAPDWMQTARFDVMAKPPGYAARPQLRLMLQGLLAERFKLQTHREKKEVSGYELVPAKNGFKLKPVEPGGNDFYTGTGMLRASKVSMSQFADWLARRVGRPVEDKTGTKDVYSFELTYTPDTPDPDGPSIFTAIQDQLGLKLQGQKTMVDVLIVDRCERMPTEN